MKSGNYSKNFVCTVFVLRILGPIVNEQIKMLRTSFTVRPGMLSVKVGHPPFSPSGTGLDAPARRRRTRCALISTLTKGEFASQANFATTQTHEAP